MVAPAAILKSGGRGAIRLRLEIECGASTCVHVKGHGAVLVDDVAAAPPPLETQCFAHPEVDRGRSSPLGAGHTQEAITDCKIPTDGDLEIARLQLDRSRPRFEPGLLLLLIDTVMGEGRGEIEDGCVGRKLCGELGGVLVEVGVAEIFENGQDRVLVAGGGAVWANIARYRCVHRGGRHGTLLFLLMLRDLCSLASRSGPGVARSGCRLRQWE